MAALKDPAPRHPPRVLSIREAATYCGVSELDFGELVRAKRLSGPIAASWGWDIVALDQAIDRISGVSRDAPLKTGGLALFIEQRNVRKAAEAAARAEAEKGGKATGRGRAKRNNP